MKLHLEAGSRVVEIEMADGAVSLHVLRATAERIFDHLGGDPVVEASAVGFQAERRADEFSEPDPQGSRFGRRLGGDGRC